MNATIMSHTGTPRPMIQRNRVGRLNLQRQVSWLVSQVRITFPKQLASVVLSMTVDMYEYTYSCGGSPGISPDSLLGPDGHRHKI